MLLGIILGERTFILIKSLTTERWFSLAKPTGVQVWRLIINSWCFRGESAIDVVGSEAEVADDYTKKKHVFRLRWVTQNQDWGSGSKRPNPFKEFHCFLSSSLNFCTNFKFLVAFIDFCNYLKRVFVFRLSNGGDYLSQCIDDEEMGMWISNINNKVQHVL